MLSPFIPETGGCEPTRGIGTCCYMGLRAPPLYLRPDYAFHWKRDKMIGLTLQ